MTTGDDTKGQAGHNHALGGGYNDVDKQIVLFDYLVSYSINCNQLLLTQGAGEESGKYYKFHLDWRQLLTSTLSQDTLLIYTFSKCLVLSE